MRTKLSHIARNYRRVLGRRGATMVEFALFFVIFMVLTVGLMELGRAVWTYVTLSHAARAGGRYAIVHGSINPIPDDGLSVTDVVRQNAIGLTGSDVGVTVSYDTANKQGSVVQIEVSYPFRFISGGIIGGRSSIDMKSTARMVVLN